MATLEFVTKGYEESVAEHEGYTVRVQETRYGNDAGTWSVHIGRPWQGEADRHRHPVVLATGMTGLGEREPQKSLPELTMGAVRLESRDQALQVANAMAELIDSFK